MADETLRADEVRSLLLAACRDFFLRRGYCEVITPIVLPAPAMEAHIDAIECGGGYLRTSPELQMKVLLSRGHSRIFQIGPCFRRGEYGRLHRPEFLMLEWYRARCSYQDVLLETRSLLHHVVQQLETTARITDQWCIRGPWEVLSVKEAFLKFAGWDPVVEFDDDRFWYDLAFKVEPSLPPHQPQVLMHYPIKAGGFARSTAENDGTVERWELYVGGVELANGCSEIVSPREQEQRFKVIEQFRRKQGKEVYPLDHHFMCSLAHGIPPCAGVALGLDRLLMLLLGEDSLDSVVSFESTGI